MEPKKTCPFCGGKNLYLESMLIDVEPVFFVVCLICSCEGPTSAIPEIAAALWDARDTDGTAP